MEPARPRRRRMKRHRALGAAGCLSAAAAVGLLRSSDDRMTLRSTTLRSTVSDRRALQTTIPPQCYTNLLANPSFATGDYAPWE